MIQPLKGLRVGCANYLQEPCVRINMTLADQICETQPINITDELYRTLKRTEIVLTKPREDGWGTKENN